MNSLYHFLTGFNEWQFWNVKVVSRRPNSTPSADGEQQEPAYLEEERRETPASLREKQVRMEQQVYRIWTYVGSRYSSVIVILILLSVLSAFEESSAACISDMLRQVSNGQYLDAIRMAEKFILHVEVLFATIDDLEFHFYRLGMKGQLVVCLSFSLGFSSSFRHVSCA
jgi:hypothetical protein